MAKGDKSKSGRAKVPKRISGAKVPKTLRKSGIVQWALSTEGREIIGGLLLAGATALTAEKRDGVRRGAKSAGSTLEAAGRALAGAVATHLGAPGDQTQLPSGTGKPRKAKPRPPAH